MRKLIVLLALIPCISFAQEEGGLTVSTEFEGGVYIENVYVTPDTLSKVALEEEIIFLKTVTEFMDKNPNMILGEKRTTTSFTGLVYVKRHYAILIEDVEFQSINPF